jgi:hypothetical protein
MEIERAKRFASATDMRAALNVVRQARLIDPTQTTNLAVAAVALIEPAPASQKRGQRGLAMIGVLALLALGVLIGSALQASTVTVNSASTGTAPAVVPQASTATATATPSFTPSPTATATLTGTHSFTPTLTSGMPITATLTIAAPAGQIQPTTVHATQPAVNPTPKLKVTPPGQAKPKNTPPGKAKDASLPVATSQPATGNGNGGNSDGGKTPKPKK